jgi:hypothetical protein
MDLETNDRNNGRPLLLLARILHMHAIKCMGNRNGKIRNGRFFPNPNSALISIKDKMRMKALSSLSPRLLRQ